jgi:hypothetical protein
MKTKLLWVSLLATALLLAGCAREEFDPDNVLTMAMQVDLPPPPVPDATVLMTNSKGEAVFQGVTDKYGRAQGTSGPGRMDHILNVTVTTPDAQTYQTVIDIPPGYTLEYIHLNKLDGYFSTRFRYPGTDNRDSDKGEERD